MDLKKKIAIALDVEEVPCRVKMEKRYHALQGDPDILIWDAVLVWDALRGSELLVLPNTVYRVEDRD